MGDFEYDGVIYLDTKTGKNHVIALDNTIFKYHVGVKAIQDVISRKKKKASIWHLKPKERALSAAVDMHACITIRLLHLALNRFLEYTASRLR
jgi:hypothetical protein